jgi:RNA ligase
MLKHLTIIKDNAIYSHISPYPTLKFRGTVKCHGTNSAIVKYKNEIDFIHNDNTLNYHYEFQSRERTLAIDCDNNCFMISILKKDYQKLFEGIEFNNSCAIYGEWCGEGIQSGVAISKLPKMFIIFAVRIDDVYQDMENFKYLKNDEQNIYNILQFETFSIEIDFNNPELIQNKLIELTTAVEKECLIGKYFGISGVGEGIVWECVNGNERYIFKVKGEKHQNSKVKTLTTVNTEEIQNIKAFVDYAVTENRLLQGIDKMKEFGFPLDTKTTGDYLRWVYNDVIKEENDTIIANGIDCKKIGGAISTKARIFWLNYLNTNLNET